MALRPSCRNVEPSDLVLLHPFSYCSYRPLRHVGRHCRCRRLLSVRRQNLLGCDTYRDFTVEYPIFAFPFFLLPRVFATTELAYAGVFVLEMLAVNACLMWSVFRAVESRNGAEQAGRALNWYVLCVSALAPMALGRFDLVPAWLAFLATLAIVRHGRAVRCRNIGRHRLSR